MKDIYKIIFFFIIFTIPTLFIIYIISPIIDDNFPERVSLFGIPFGLSGFIFAVIVIIAIPIICLLIGYKQRELRK